MNIDNIINTNYHTVEEQQYLVEQYIKEKKGLDININLTKYLDLRDIFDKASYMVQVEKLSHAFEYARAYFINKQKV
jgi:hypothetical protein